MSNNPSPFGLAGRLVRAGTMQVSGEELIGCAVECAKMDLRSLRRLPMHQRVVILEASEVVKIQEAFQEIADEAAKHHEHNPVSGIDRLPAGYSKILNMADAQRAKIEGFRVDGANPKG